MTASTPPLVDVIAGVLREHYVGIDPRHNGLRCECGQAVQTDDAAHQARAVLDALTKAGGVEWGVRWAGEDDVTEYQPSDEASVTSCMRAEIAWAKRNAIRAPLKGELVSRSVGPWAAVEE